MRWVEAHFGRRKGLARLGLSYVQSSLGRYDRFRAVDWTRVRRWVFVCEGNICRSPYAEARARSLGLNAASFGLGAADGDSADVIARRTALKRGLDLSSHRSTSPPSFRADGGDLLVAMEPSQGERLVALTQGTSAQCTLLGVWAQPTRPHIEDPYGLSPAYFETCFNIIDSGVTRLSAWKRAAHRS